MKTIVFAAGLGCALIAGPAFAQDAGSDYTGLYAGPVAGYDRLTVDDEIDGSDSSDGVVYGAVVGYDFAVGSAVLGVEAELTDSSISQTEFDFFEEGDEFAVGAGLDLYVGARAGIRVGRAGLLYVKGGYSELDVDYDYDGPTVSLSGTEAIGGYRLGAGGEFALSRRLGARVEYRYSNYGSGDELGEDVSLGVLERHQVMAALLYRF
ncbi:outer membrane protein [Qipengyuania atrilutea]|uniref:Porin family protein n=1 Tax=Qipengyuania atrilutea TaxID=2744473 RepID=A0A850H177_9SPHN|nr:outer membrane beta-barrel protein [Actirhodobacter atriluteus]NVD45691.1 porin family protein [Actirhodobacter atriluteus]